MLHLDARRATQAASRYPISIRGVWHDDARFAVAAPACRSLLPRFFCPLLFDL